MGKTKTLMRKLLIASLILVCQGEPVFSLVRKAQLVAPTSTDDDQSISDSSDHDYYEELLPTTEKELNEEHSLLRLNLASDELPKRLPYGKVLKDMSTLTREMALVVPVNLMDAQIPSSEELFLDTPLWPEDERPESLEKTDNSYIESKYVVQDALTGEEDSENPDNGMTASGVSLHFDDISENSEDSGGSEGSEKSAPFEKITEAAKWALERFMYWLGWSKSSVLDSNMEFMKNLVFPEVYNVNYSHINGFYEIGFGYAPKVRSLDSPAKYSPSGKDSFFIAGVFGAGSLALGITEGIDEQLVDDMDSTSFSRELCHAMKNTFLNDKIRSAMDPVSLQKEAFEVVKANTSVEGGSATVLVAVFTPKNTVQISNLGVSQAMLFRNGRIKYSSSLTLDSIGSPRRLTKPFLRGGPRFLSANSPEDGKSAEWELQKDDFLVFASDGITRNLDVEQLEGIVDVGISHHSHASAISSTIFSRALFRSIQAPVDMGGEWAKYGGFSDDLTVVVVRIKN